MKRKKEGR